MSWLEVNTYRILVDYYVHFNTFRAKILKQNITYMKKQIENVIYCEDIDKNRVEII